MVGWVYTLFGTLESQSLLEGSLGNSPVAFRLAFCLYRTLYWQKPRQLFIVRELKTTPPLTSVSSRVVKRYRFE